jgi:hypothetical protein
MRWNKLISCGRSLPPRSTALAGSMRSMISMCGHVFPSRASTRRSKSVKSAKPSTYTVAAFSCRDALTQLNTCSIRRRGSRRSCPT